ncbi:hypothetical protein BY996DRAFT_6422011 [Phakopsora pachyrhizi]|nr:hypothetical protein BY996DRAFT_6422011 [Phakopsora pachyrhizi]
MDPLMIEQSALFTLFLPFAQTEAPENSSNNLNSGSYERFCKNVLDPISVSNPFKVQIDAIAEEVQKKNQVASKIALAVMSKLDGKPDDVHDEEYHTMIEGMLSNKEFRKTLPAGLVEQYYDLTCGYSRPDQFGPAPSSFSESDNLNLFNGNLITILINATKKATNATAAFLGNHNKTINPGTFLSASTVAMAPHPNSSPGLPSHSNLRRVQWVVALVGRALMSSRESISMEKIKCTPKLKAVVVVYCIRARGLMDKLFMEDMVMEILRIFLKKNLRKAYALGVRAGGCKACLRLHIWTIHCLSEGRGSAIALVSLSTLSCDPGQVLIDDQLAKQLGVTTGTDDQISRPSVTPIKDSIGHHPPNKFSSYVTWCDNSISPQSQPLPCQRWAQQTTVSSSGATPSLGTLNATLWIQDGQLKTRPNQSLNTWTNALLSLDLSKPWNTGPSLSLIRPDSGDP